MLVSFVETRITHVDARAQMLTVELKGSVAMINTTLLGPAKLEEKTLYQVSKEV